MTRISIINGPNLNLLGSRENDIYGNESFESFLLELKKRFSQVEISYHQSNVEGELINFIQTCRENCTGVLLNAGGFTHTSIAIRDSISAIQTPVIEIHISNVAARESFRHTSMLTGVCRGLVMGFGLESYALGIGALLQK